MLFSTLAAIIAGVFAIPIALLLLGFIIGAISGSPDYCC